MHSEKDTYSSGSEDEDHRHVEEETDSLSAAIMYQYQKMAETGECSDDTETRRKRYQKDSYFSDEEELDD